MKTEKTTIRNQFLLINKQNIDGSREVTNTCQLIHLEYYYIIIIIIPSKILTVINEITLILLHKPYGPEFLLVFIRASTS